MDDTSSRRVVPADMQKGMTDVQSYRLTLPTRPYHFEIGVSRLDAVEIFPQIFKDTRMTLTTNARLAIAMFLTFAIMVFAGRAGAELFVLTPDAVTGQVEFHVNTNTNDARLTKTCVYRIDALSPDVDVPIACVDVSAGRAPVGSEISPSGEGVFLAIPAAVSILAEDQIFGVKNIATVAGVDVPSIIGPNTTVLPMGVVAPLFVVLGQ